MVVWSEYLLKSSLKMQQLCFFMLLRTLFKFAGKNDVTSVKCRINLSSSNHASFTHFFLYSCHLILFRSVMCLEPVPEVNKWTPWTSFQSNKVSTKRHSRWTTIYSLMPRINWDIFIYHVCFKMGVFKKTGLEKPHIHIHN